MQHKRLGLTGSIGAGKTTVARLLRERGLTVLDADEVAREVSGQMKVLREVAARLGPQFVTAGGLNRPALADLVFHDPKKRGVLNAIVHPRVRARMVALEEEATGTWIVQDVPLLFENDLDKLMDATLLVDAPQELRLKRVAARDNLTPQQFLARDRAQMPSEEKRRRASVVLDNGGDLAFLELQLGAALVRLGVEAG